MNDLAYCLQQLEKYDPQHIALGLERLRNLPDIAQLTRFDCPVITVTGSNGKGSFVALAESILRCAKLRVGCYTSPHLWRFNERIRVNGQAITDDALVNALRRAETYRGNTPLTYFEVTTLAAFIHFQQHPLDVLILEVGLGGRLDAVNIVDADVAVITSIDLEHTTWLGHTRAAIAREKAGILRAGKPLICGDPCPPATLLAHAEALQTPTYIAKRDFTVAPHSDTWDCHTPSRSYLDLPCVHLGVDNAAITLQALSVLPSHITIPTDAVREGLQGAQLLGRFQCVPGRVLSIFDVAHNPAAAAYLALRLQQQPCQGKTLAVVGMLADKDSRNTFAALLPHVHVWHVSNLDTPRTASAQRLQEELVALSATRVTVFDTIVQAYQAAQRLAESGDRILVFGSFYTVSALLQTDEHMLNPSS